MCSADTQNELKKVHEKFIKTSENPLQLSINATEQHWGSSSGTAAGQTTLLQIRSCQILQRGYRASKASRKPFMMSGPEVRCLTSATQCIP